MASKQKHYNLDNIEKIGANFNIIYGEKSNGKSYQVKHKKAIKKYLQTGRRFILLRRWKEDISNSWIEQYFADVDIESLTENKYNCISCYRKTLYLATVDEFNKVKRGEKIGYVMALSTEQHYSGASYLDVDDIIFEEFMERGVYIAREPDKLMTFYSTVDRKRGTTKLWMVGNTISRVCPYLNEWNLQPIVRKQKQGDIDTLTIHNEENDVVIAIEYCKASGGKTMTIGNASKMIDKGAWQTQPQPHLPKSRKCYKMLFRCAFQYQSFRFIGEYLVDKDDRNNTCWFVYPKYTEIKKGTLVFSDTVKIDMLWQRDIYNISIPNNKLKLLFQTFRDGNIFYSDDLCGTDFKQVIDFDIRR